MKFEDVGINPETGRHNRQLTTTENRFLGLLWVDHAGADNKISAQSLARKFARTQGEYIGTGPGWEKALQTWMREVRRMQNHLVCEHNIPLLSRSGNNGGYWIAETDYEAAQFYGAFRQRGLTGLKKAARGKQAVLVEMVEQLSLEFDRLDDRAGETVETISGRATNVEIVDRLFTRMLMEPERYGSDLKKIHRRLSSVLMPKERIRKIAHLAAELVENLAGLN